MERLDKVLASTGRWSRREAKELIREGRVLVDGQPAGSGEQKVDPAGTALLVDGQAVAVSRFTYVMLHKPAGVLSATEDPRQETVLDLLPEHLRRRGLFPVGRLDKDTEGLLLLTDFNSPGTTGRWLTACSPRKNMWISGTTPGWTALWGRRTRPPSGRGSCSRTVRGA